MMKITKNGIIAEEYKYLVMECLSLLVTTTLIHREKCLPYRVKENFVTTCKNTLDPTLMQRLTIRLITS
jgi:hypothetical protein